MIFKVLLLSILSFNVFASDVYLNIGEVYQDDKVTVYCEDGVQSSPSFWECSVNASTFGIFVGGGYSKTSASADAINKCQNSLKSTGWSMLCHKKKNLTCSRVQ